MGYTLVGLEDKILEMYPEILENNIRPRLTFNEEKDAWYITLKKDDGTETVVCLNKEDADACMDNTFCQSFKEDIGKAIKELGSKK